MKVFLCQPCYQAPPAPECSEAFERVAVRLAKKGMLVDDEMPWARENRDSNQARARNVLFHRGLKTDADRFLLCDPDQNPTPESIEALIAHDDDVVVPLINRKSLERSTVGFPFFGPDGKPIERRRAEDQAPLLRMAHIGFGVVSIARRVIERLTAAEGHYFVMHMRGHACDGERVAALVEHAVVGEAWESVDHCFSRKWAALGGEMWCDSGVVVGHVGVHEFK